MTPETAEALSLLTEEVAQLGSRVDSVIPKIEAMAKTLSSIESLLVATLRKQANDDDQEQRRRLAHNERFERIERAIKLRPA